MSRIVPKHVMNSHKNCLKYMIHESLTRNINISICTSRADIKLPDTKVDVYINYNKRIENIYEELANEILYDIESCASDYPERYICLSTSKNPFHSSANMTVLKYPDIDPKLYIDDELEYELETLDF